MLTIRLIGSLLSLSGVFIATRGTGWHFSYIFMGLLLLGSGIIMLASGRPPVTAGTAAPKNSERRPIMARPGRNRRGVAAATA